MSKEVKVALIGAAAVIIAAIISGIFLLRSGSGASSTFATANTNVPSTAITSPSMIETQPAQVTPLPGQTPGLDVNGAVSTMSTFCQDIDAGAMQ